MSIVTSNCISLVLLGTLKGKSMRWFKSTSAMSIIKLCTFIWEWNLFFFLKKKSWTEMLQNKTLTCQALGDFLCMKVVLFYCGCFVLLQMHLVLTTAGSSILSKIGSCSYLLKNNVTLPLNTQLHNFCKQAQPLRSLFPGFLRGLWYVFVC